MNNKTAIFAIIAIAIIITVSGCQEKEKVKKQISDSEILTDNEISEQVKEIPQPKIIEPTPEKISTTVDDTKSKVPETVLNSTSNSTIDSPKTVYNAPTGLSSIADTTQKNITLVDCPKITLPAVLRIPAPTKDEFGINQFTINDNNMDRLTFSDKWVLVKKTQLQCKEKDAGKYSCPSFVIQKYKLNEFMSIQGLDYLEYSKFVIEVYDVAMDKDPLTDKLIQKASFRIAENECIKYDPKKA